MKLCFFVRPSAGCRIANANRNECSLLALFRPRAMSELSPECARFCCRSPLKASANNDSLTLTRSAVGMGHDGAGGAGSRAAVLFVLPLRGGIRRLPSALEWHGAWL